MKTLTIIIPASDKDSSNQWMQDNIDPGGGLQSFMSPLTSDGKTVTHYVCSTSYWSDDQQAELMSHFATTSFDTPSAVLQSLGLSRYVES